MRRPTTLLAMNPALPGRLFTPESRARLAGLTEIDLDLVVTDLTDSAADAALARTEVLFTCWGVKPIDADVLARAPQLKAVVHSAGSVKGFVTTDLWRRGIVVSSCAAANAVPVAEYALSMILLTGKRVFEQERIYRAGRPRRPDPNALGGPLGNYDRRVGIIGASLVGRRLIELLQPFEYDVWVADPYLSDEAAAALGVRRVELAELMAGCDVVSVHAPSLPSTRHLLDAEMLALMPDRSVLINTARGALVDHAALTAELVTGRIDAVLDTTEPEPLPADSPLFDLPNVILTPHVAGTQGRETRRLGSWAIDEVQRYAAGEPFRFGVTEADLARVA